MLQKEDKECSDCLRLRDYRLLNRDKYPHFYNSPVYSFGDIDGSFLIVGLAPGLRGANRTGRPFTGDYAGDLLYNTLISYGFAKGIYKACKEDGLRLINCRITNAVRCVPPENKVTGEEVKNCNHRLQEEILSMKKLKLILALGTVAHSSVLMAFNLKKTKFPFIHGKFYKDISGGISLIDSYHCSRYNTNTGVLSKEMFETVFKDIKEHLGKL